MYPHALFDHDSARVLVTNIQGKTAAFRFEQQGAGLFMSVNKNAASLPGDNDDNVRRAVYVICAFAPTVGWGLTSSKREKLQAHARRRPEGERPGRVLYQDGQGFFQDGQEVSQAQDELKTDKLYLKTD